MKNELLPTKFDKQFLRREFFPMLRNCFDAFFILCTIFAVMTVMNPDFGRDYLTLLENLISDLGIDESQTPGQLFSVIFSNNVQATINTVFYGYLPFLHYPALTLGSNAMTITVMGIRYVRDGLMTPAAFFAGILPHGIFEIPALIIACAVGLCNCRLITGIIMKKKQETEPRAQMVTLSWVYVAVVFPLLLIAAAVEAFVTPHIMALFI
ncbi:MAG: stage II sporulation protein M [Oscillospiraceae bacterium]|nr:stage II sporulation protein M [Oscillospiraceae bacterium]MBR2928652.1 stage II sporulation protein M [Oscillospiraceae bacterium]